VYVDVSPRLIFAVTIALIIAIAVSYTIAFRKTKATAERHL